MIFSIFYFYVFETKLRLYNRETVSSITRENLECDENFITDIENFEKCLKNVKKIHMGFKKSVNSFDIIEVVP